MLDPWLPSKRGLEVLKDLRVLRPEVRVAVLTARSHESDVVRGLAAAAQCDS